MADVDQLDQWIATLQKCEPLSEDQVALLCDKVRGFIKDKNEY
jgi:hypothetical protein